MASAEDSRGRTITTALRPDRIVSLVPSVTESVAQLAGVKRLVGITKFCTEPEADAPAIRKIGGTKDPDIAAIVALAPDLVLANREENREEDIAALEAAGLQVYVGYPRTARDALEDLKTIARLLHFAMVRPIVALVTEEDRAAGDAQRGPPAGARVLPDLVPAVHGGGGRHLRGRT